MFAAYALAFAGVALLIVIVVRGCSAHLLSRYRAFYGYIAFVIAATLVQCAILGVLGRKSDAFYWAWHVPNLFSPLLLLLVLLSIWKKVEPPESFSRRIVLVPLVLVGSLVVILGARLFEAEGNPFFRYQAVALFAQMLVSVFVYMRVSGRREINLGRNLKGILLGVSLLVGLQGMNFAHLIFIGTPKVVFDFFLQFFYFLALSVFTYSLWNYEPITVASADYRDRLGKVGEELEKAVRILASPR